LPIGAVWASVVTPERVVERELQLPGDQEHVMSGIVDAVLGMLKRRWHRLGAKIASTRESFPSAVGL
jgi:hypothetical protein